MEALVRAHLVFFEGCLVEVRLLEFGRAVEVDLWFERF